MKEDEFAVEVLRYLRHKDPYSDVKVLQNKASQMIQEARERLVLIVGLGEGFFGFELRSIQEFFAAGYLADARDDKQRFDRFTAIALLPHWRNVALFFAGRIGRSFSEESAHILEACREIDRHKPDLFIRRGAWLALEIAADRSFGHDRVLQRSAIEYGLTLLDDDLDFAKTYDLIRKLRELPPEDLGSHVIPILRQRLYRIHLPDGFNVMEVYHGVCDDLTPLKEVIIKNIPETTSVLSTFWRDLSGTPLTLGLWPKDLERCA